jgi:prepilin-type N-terminal cleavage/methylation domain-containing protein
MCSVRRRGFTLVELLVVISIIGILMALLIPAVQAARDAARSAECKNNLRQMAIATIHYESSRKQYPGYVSKVGNKRATWVVALFPYMERNDLWEAWSDPNVNPGPTVSWGSMICPADTDGTSGNQLSYAANCGRPDVNFLDKPANGVFLNLYEQKVTTTADFISRADGQATTIMFAENIQADRWTVMTSEEAERTTGLVWHDTENTARRINGDRDATMVATSLDYARPSSYHLGGGAHVIFCGGNTKWISGSIAYHVYQQLMTPHGKKSDLPAAAKSYVLDEADF